LKVQGSRFEINKHPNPDGGYEPRKRLRKAIKGFMDSFKTNLIEMFKEEGDEEL
jgi:hypothetical protein